jgi:hypothetical protein
MLIINGAKPLYFWELGSEVLYEGVLPNHLPRCCLLQEIENDVVSVKKKKDVKTHTTHP